MHAPPTIAIIVPTLNRPHTLPTCLQSINTQTFTSWICIVINQGDAYPGRCDPRFVYVDLRKRSASLARNIGLGIARTLDAVYVCLLDDDDWIEPNYLEEMAGALDSAPQAELVACNSTYNGQTYRHDHPSTKLIGSRMLRLASVDCPRFTARSGQEKVFWRTFDNVKALYIEQILYHASRDPVGGLRDERGSY